MPAIGIDLHLDLSNIVNTVNNALRNTLGAVGSVASDIAPTGLVTDLANSLDDALSGSPTGLFKQIIGKRCFQATSLRASGA